MIKVLFLIGLLKDLKVGSDIMTTVEKRVRTVLAGQVYLSKDEHKDFLIKDLSSETDGTLELDSLDVIEVIMRLEEEFDIEISDEEIESLVVFPDLLALVESHLDGVPR